MKMQLSVGTVLALVTLIGTILVGGANFGELRAVGQSNSEKIMDVRLQMEMTAVEIRKESMENMRIVAKMSADIEWIKERLRHQEAAEARE